MVGLLLYGLSSCSQSSNETSSDQSSDSLVFKLEQVANNLISPVALTHANDGSGRKFVLEQPGRILIIKGDKVLPEPFLDLTSKVVSLNNAYAEMGLLSLAFHPDYKNNGRFFVYYSIPPTQENIDHVAVIAEYHVSASNADKADSTAKIIMKINEPESNHNGGQIAFGPDGYLYIGLGDGGGQGDQHGEIGNGQNTSQLLGSILRIDINKGEPYTIPSDNPFVGTAGRGEIYAHGFRNPWRFSFDKQTKRLFCGEVGQDKFEEVDIVEKGKNYGWRAMEGNHVYDENLRKQQQGVMYAAPIDEYEHTQGRRSVTGGYVYRGKKFGALEGKYVFAEWTGELFYLQENGSRGWERKEPRMAGKTDNKVDVTVNSFGEDEEGEIYMVAQRLVGANSPSGVVYRVTVAK